MNPIALCSRCVLPSNFPGVSLQGGVCNFCLNSSSERVINRKAELAVEIELAIKSARGLSEYDCIVAFSGGKDSSYTLKLLVEKYKLNCLAITVDNGFISEQAQRNCKTITASLGVDFITYVPAFEFMKRMYVTSAVNDSIHAKSAVKRASSMCNSCINLINSYMLKAAIRHEAPLVAGGYIGGQVPRDSAVLVIDVKKQKELRSIALRKNVEHFGPAAERHFNVGSAQVATNNVTIINPMLSVNLSEDEIISSIGELGWVRTRDTGLNSSNCRLNDLGIAVHYKKHQFHPYVFEVSEQVRSGTISRDEALGKIAQIPAFADLQSQIDQLGLEIGAL
jgi:predicted subunit of tRNA(5-methylaminomethyl-2-thiouridylate) methyltransferase